MVALTLNRVGTAVVDLEAGTEKVVGSPMTALLPPGLLLVAVAAVLAAAASLLLWPTLTPPVTRPLLVIPSTTPPLPAWLHFSTPETRCRRRWRERISKTA